MGGLVDHWPLVGLVVRTPWLEMRWPSESDLVALAELAAEGIHDPDEMPFAQPWTRAPEGELERNVIQFHWLSRGEWAPDRWSWNPVVVVDGAIVGTQGMVAEDFVLRRTVSTGSWLGQRYQRQGIGTEMRAAVLHLAFAGLRALRAETGAWEDNIASLTVTRKLGYQPNGDRVHLSEGQPRRELSFVLLREQWETGARDDIEIEGLPPCLGLFGVADRSARTESNHPASAR